MTVDFVELSPQIGRGRAYCSGGDLPKELPVRSLADVPYAPGLRKLLPTESRPYTAHLLSHTGREYRTVWKGDERQASDLQALSKVVSNLKEIHPETLRITREDNDRELV